MSLPINSTIGDYQLTDYIGAGGMGEVYRAVHSRLGRVSAIKVLTHFIPGSHAVERFLNEARIQARLHHPNIVTLYDFVEKNGRPCIVMEFVHGQTLDVRVNRLGPLPLEEILITFKSLLEAIQYLHEHGIVHRDIKSNNIKIDADGQVKLLDFGIAKDAVSPSLTVSDACVGTPQYLAPEQIQGKAADPRSDIWALGVVLYEMCTGQLPFPQDSSSGLYKKIINADYTVPAGLNPVLPEELVAIISRCLQKRRIQRYSSVSEIIRDIDRCNATMSAPGLSLRDKNLAGHAMQTIRNMVEDFWPLIIATTVLFMITLGSFYLYKVDARTDGKSVDDWVDHKVDAIPPILEGKDKSHQQTVGINVVGEPAEVYLDNVKVGVTPYPFQGLPGEIIRLQLRRKCYQPVSAEITVQNTQEPYTYRLRPVSAVECQW
ncbi:MAG: serine/threonine-protein kinase [Methylococcales bacterium]